MATLGQKLCKSITPAHFSARDYNIEIINFLNNTCLWQGYSRREYFSDQYDISSEEDTGEMGINSNVLRTDNQTIFLSVWSSRLGKAIINNSKLMIWFNENDC